MLNSLNVLCAFWLRYFPLSKCTLPSYIYIVGVDVGVLSYTIKVLVLSTFTCWAINVVNALNQLPSSFQWETSTWAETFHVQWIHNIWLHCLKIIRNALAVTSDKTENVSRIVKFTNCTENMKRPRYGGFVYFWGTCIPKDWQTARQSGSQNNTFQLRLVVRGNYRANLKVFCWNISRRWSNLSFVWPYSSCVILQFHLIPNCIKLFCFQIYDWGSV